jgi:hypothetical protein
VVEAVLLAAAGSRATGSALYGVTGGEVGGLVGVAALSAIEGDGKSDAAFLSETAFFSGWLGFLRRAAAPKRAAYLGARRAVPAIVVPSVYYNCGRWKVR